MSDKTVLRLLVPALILFIGMWVVPAHAACPLCTCTASATGVAFGTYNQSVATQSTGSVTIACSVATGSGTVAYSIALGAGGSGSAPARTLTSGGSAVSYNLYTAPSYTSVWGDGTGGTGTVSDSYSLTVLTTRNYTVYGRIPSAQIVPAGAYGDSIVVTINY